jgi:hypothetical protein
MNIYPDALQVILDGKRSLLEAIGVKLEADTSPQILTSPLFKDALINASLELHEAIDPLMKYTRPWKAKAADSEAREHVLEETVDVMFFLAEAWLLAGLNAQDIADRFTTKLEFNMQRLEAARVREVKLEEHLQTTSAAPLLSSNLSSVIEAINTFLAADDLHVELRAALSNLAWHATFFPDESVKVMNELKVIFDKQMDITQQHIFLAIVNTATANFLRPEGA